MKSVGFEQKKVHEELVKKEKKERFKGLTISTVSITDVTMEWMVFEGITWLLPCVDRETGACQGVIHSQRNVWGQKEAEQHCKVRWKRTKSKVFLTPSDQRAASHQSIFRSASLRKHIL